MVSVRVMKAAFAAAVVIAIALMMNSVSAYADGLVHYEGTDSNGIEWTYDDGVLVLSGSGPTEDYMNPNYQAWSFRRAGFMPDFNVKKVIVSEGITRVGDCTFSNYSSIETVTLPRSLTSVGWEAFMGCTNAVFSISDTGSSSNFLPNVTTIDHDAFIGCQKIEQLKFSDKLESIGYYAFKGCTSLSKVTLPSNVETVQMGAFQNTAIKYIAPVGKYSEDVLEYPWEGDEIPRYIDFSYCPAKKIVFPDGTTTITVGFCSHLEDLLEVSFPDSVTTIQLNAFEYCNSLKEIDWSDKTNLKYIGSGLFFNCKSLEKAILPDQVKRSSDGANALYEGTEGLFEGCKSLTKVYIPESWTEIPFKMFYECTSLTESGIEWPAAVDTIGRNAFRESGIKTMNIPSTVETIDSYAFYGCENLSKVHIPAGVNYIDDAFAECPLLLTAGPSELSDSYNIVYDWTGKIPSGAFTGSMIKSADIGDSITEIDGAFTLCKNLEKVILPDSVKDIDNAFRYCDLLKTVRLSRTIESIRGETFENCKNLKVLLFRGNAPSEKDFSTKAFKGCNITCYYPANDPTWTRRITGRQYEGKVTWKPYTGTVPVLADRERTATLNGGGTIKARFYLVDENGMAMPEVRFKFKRRALGKVEEFDSDMLLTDFDGGYDFSAPYIVPEDGNVDVEFYDFKVLSRESTKLENGLTFIIHGSASPLVYSKEWSFSFGASGQAELGSALKGKLATKNSGKIKLEHNKDGKEDLTLSLSITDALQGALGGKTSLLDENNGVAGLDVKKRSGSGEVDYVRTYKRTIKNYDPDNKAHQQQVSAYLLLTFLCSTTSDSMARVEKYAGETFEPFMTTATARILNNLIDVTFTQSGDAVKVKVSGSGAVVSFAAEETPFVDFTLGSVSGDAEYSVSKDLDESKAGSKETTYSTGLTTESSYSMFTTTLFEAIGTTGLFGRSKINDTSASFTVSSKDAKENSASLSHCEFDSGFKEFVGWDDVQQYHEFTAEGDAAAALAGSNKTYKALKAGKVLPLIPDTYKNLLKAFMSSEDPVEWSDTESLGNSYSLPIELGTKKKDKDNDKDEDKAKIKVEFKLSGSKTYETEMKNGSYANGVVYYTADAAETVRNAVNADGSDLSDLGNIVKAPVDVVGDWIGDLIDDASGTIGRTIETGKAILSSTGVTDHNWNFHVYKIKPDTTKKTSKGSGSLKRLPGTMRIFTLQESDDTADGDNTAVIIGEPYYIAVEDLDKDGEEVQDITEAGAVLTIGYSQEEVDAAAKGKDGGALAIYRKNAEKGGFDYVDGTIDADAKTVTADITKTGEYVLAFDASSPSITNFRYNSKKGSIKVDIGSFSGVSSGELTIDGKTWISGTEFAKFYHADTGVFSVVFTGTTVMNKGDHTVVVKAVDEAGHETTAEFTYSILNAPVLTEASATDFWYGGDIRVTCSVTSNDPESLHVWAEVTPDNSREVKDVCVLQRSGDEWVLDYRADDAMSRYEFEIYAQDKHGKSGSRSVGSSYYPETGEEINGLNYWIDKASGEIRISKVYDDDIEDYVCPDVADLIIPSEVAGFAVRGLSADLMAGSKNLKSVVMPSTLRYISDSAFEGCPALAKVTLNDGLEEIGEKAFFRCDSLGKVTIPSSVIKIGRNAFGSDTDPTDPDDPTDPTDPDDPTDPEQHKHTMEYHKAVDPTCTEAGNSEYWYCAECKQYFGDEKGVNEIKKDSWVIPAKSHDWGPWTVVTKPTETEPGLKRRTCKNDPDHTEEKVIPAGDHVHDLVKVDGIKATCTENGRKDYWYCAECDTKFADENGENDITDDDDLIIKAKGHIEYILPGKAATCTEDGYTKSVVCLICGEVLTASETIKATGFHIWEEDYYIKASIWGKGERAYHCTECYKDKIKYYAKLKPQIKLSAKSKKIKKKKSFTLTVSKVQRGDEVSSVKSSKKGIVKIKKTKKNKYKITGKNKGKTVITVKLLSGKKAKCTVTVK